MCQCVTINTFSYFFYRALEPRYACGTCSSHYETPGTLKYANWVAWSRQKLAGWWVSPPTFLSKWRRGAGGRH